MKLRRLQGVIEFQLLRQFVTRDQHQRGHEATYDRGPRLHHGTTGGDGGEAAEESVAYIGNVPVTWEDSFSEESGESRGAPG